VLRSIGPDHVHARTSDGILVYALRSPGEAERVDIIEEILVFVRERRSRPGTSAQAAELLEAIERRLTLELQAAAAAGISPGAEAPDRPG
jgi:hypothetical protein